MTGADTRQWQTLRELDELEGRVKGSAFRCFKALSRGWTEGCEFRVLEATRDAGQIGRLKRENRIYAGTVNAILLSPEAARAIRSALGAH
jgi:hypothetical protein